MAASWLNASAVDSFEGRVLTRGAPLVDFRLPRSEPTVEESVLFVAPPNGGEIEYDVNVDADGVGLSPVPAAPDAPDLSTRHSTPGAHWLVAPRTLSPDDPRMSGSYTRDGAPAGWDDENTLTLPVIPLCRRRRVDVAAVASELLGTTTSARATRLFLALAALFALLAIKSLNGRAPTLRELTSMGSEAPPVAAAAPKLTSLPRVVLPARHTPPPVIIRSAAPVWILAPRRDMSQPVPVSPSAEHPLGLPRPAPPPRTEVARL
jgi:hypothetical protein